MKTLPLFVLFLAAASALYPLPWKSCESTYPDFNITSITLDRKPSIGSDVALEVCGRFTAQVFCDSVTYEIKSGQEVYVDDEILLEPTMYSNLFPNSATAKFSH